MSPSDKEKHPRFRCRLLNSGGYLRQSIYFRHRQASSTHQRLYYPQNNPSDIFTLGTEHSDSALEIAEAVKNATGKDFEVIVGDVKREVQQD